MSEGSLSKSDGLGDKTYEPNENLSDYSIEIQPAKVELLDNSAQCDVPMTYETPIQTEGLKVKESCVQTSPEHKPTQQNFGVQHNPTVTDSECQYSGKQSPQKPVSHAVTPQKTPVKTRSQASVQ